MNGERRNLPPVGGFHFHPAGPCGYTHADGKSCTRLTIPRSSAMPTPRRVPRSVGVLLGVAALAATSCSSSGTLHPVRGKVVVGDKPAAGATVMFHPEGGDLNSVPATAIVGPDG